MKKIRFTVSYFMKEVLKEDKEYFGAEIGAIGNRLFEYYANKDIDKIDLKISGGQIVQFNLSKYNEEMYYKILQEHSVETEAEYLRDIFFTYINNPRYKREKILFDKTFRDIEEAIAEKKKVNIKYNGEIRTVNPYFIKVADGENRSYLFCYCEKNNDYRCYRMSEIKNIMVSKKDVEVKDSRYIENIYNNFDPFRSYGKRVKVKFTDKGKELLKKVVSNRPKILENTKDEYVFECDIKLAQVYFPQFFSEVEILEPKELQEWFRDKFKKGYDLYRGKLCGE